MRNAIASFARLGITQNNSHASNYLFSPRDRCTCAVVIDLGEGYVREDETDEEWEEYAVEQGIQGVLHISWGARMP